MQYESLNSLNEDSSQIIVVNRIKRIIEKYSDVWRVFHEPIQNSIDAIQKRNDIREGAIQVTVKLKSNIVTVQDEGSGFPQNFQLLLPDGTDKIDQSDTMGYQGVGLKSVIYSSNRFHLKSKLSDGSMWDVEISNAAKYLETEGADDAPISIGNGGLDEQGTLIEIEFDNNLVISALEEILDIILYSESNFRWKWPEVQQQNFHLKDKSKADMLLYLLRYYFTTHTYIGSVHKLMNTRLRSNEDVYAKKINIEIKLDFEELETSDVNDEFLKEVISELSEEERVLKLELKNKFIDFNNIIDSVRSENPRVVPFNIHEFDIPPGGRVGNPVLKSQVYLKTFTPDYSKNEDDYEARYKEFLTLINPGSIDRYDRNKRRFKNFLPNIMGIYILIGRMDYYEQFLGNNYGIKLIAANGIPTQHELTARSSNQSFYFNPITFILNVDGKLNEGKTELINTGLRRKSVEFFREAFECTLNRLTKEFVNKTPNTSKIEDSNFVQQDDIDIPGVDIKKIPTDENTLIALFYQLLKVREQELPTYGLLSQGVFDGKFVYEDGNVRSENDLLSLEFKVNCSNLVDDFDNPNNPKVLINCDLLITWNDRLTTTQQQDWRIVNRTSVQTNDLVQSRCPDWITTLIRDKDHNYKPIIIVKDWVDELNQANSD
ncbi:MAG: hypothetical protein WD048_00040 [Chitinophagales bacterium]